ncbi:MlaD family protein [Pontixanthobacter aestiaquae]|uniref:MCE family protein n=1 Tax=Pontixanthobacter aestiaquae TaxID=1509367 RepID=A0A844ZAL8_9SPHN|nr:MlaD family protein [Pontixanthobacter aestiaquae]MDN3646109.1 MlaD family protein [Pontixanthobacter aestiaquae]MXO82899.1 MCE family protein [Pontixanthobacter aestiaquae]
METRANHLWVGAVTLVLLGALAAFIVWLAQLGQGEQKQYDILFGQDVSGLANGSQVSFAGVPVGRVSEIKLYEDNLEFVRVRIEVEKEVPILIGTTATIQGSFTGVSTILLEGARQGAPPITCETTACFSENVPQIPPKAGGLGALLSSAPVLLERLATLTERMTELLSDRNQSEISAILANTNRMTDQLADTGPQIQATMKELENTLREGAEALDAFEKVTQSTDNLLNQEGAQLAVQLRETLGGADAAAKSLSATLEDARPATRQLSTQTLPAVEATLADLKATSQALRNVTERLENEGASSLLGSPPLPEYEP